MIASAISGLAAISRNKADTLDGFLVNVFKGTDVDMNSFMCTFSADPKCIEKSLMWTWHAGYNEDNLLLIGKSLGAVRTWWLAYNHWDEIKHFKKIRIILIDPHGWQRGDGRWGSYGRKMLNGKWRDLERNTSWSLHSDFKIINLYQRDGGYPRGAILLNAWCLRSYWPVCVTQNIKLPPGANHWNCTDIKTDTGQFVAGIIREVVEELE